MNPGLTLDAGALIAIERQDRFVVSLVQRALDREVRIVVPAGVLGQVWREGSRQARLAKLLATDGVSVEPLDDRRARPAGRLCGLRGTTDVIDASVVVGARVRGDRIVTSDPEDLVRLDPRAELIVV